MKEMFLYWVAIIIINAIVWVGIAFGIFWAFNHFFPPGSF